MQRSSFEINNIHAKGAGLTSDQLFTYLSSILRDGKTYKIHIWNHHTLNSQGRKLNSHTTPHITLDGEIHEGVEDLMLALRLRNAIGTYYIDHSGLFEIGFDYSFDGKIYAKVVFEGDMGRFSGNKDFFVECYSEIFNGLSREDNEDLINIYFNNFKHVLVRLSLAHDKRPSLDFEFDNRVGPEKNIKSKLIKAKSLIKKHIKGLLLENAKIDYRDLKRDHKLFNKKIIWIADKNEINYSTRMVLRDYSLKIIKHIDHDALASIISDQDSVPF